MSWPPHAACVISVGFVWAPFDSSRDQPRSSPSRQPPRRAARPQSRCASHRFQLYFAPRILCHAGRPFCCWSRDAGGRQCTAADRTHYDGAMRIKLNALVDGRVRLLKQVCLHLAPRINFQLMQLGSTQCFIGTEISSESSMKHCIGYLDCLALGGCYMVAS